MKILNISYGFTLIELLVVISILGILASISLTNYSSSRHKANVTKAKSDLYLLRTAITSLEIDTDLLPGKLDPEPCIQNQESFVNECVAGIQSQCSAPNNFPGWNGPYMSAGLIDPWGRAYYFDPDYYCRTNVEGCKDIPDNGVVRALVSFGRKYSGSFPEAYDDGDNVVLVLCRS